MTRRTVLTLAALSATATAMVVGAYPLDGHQRTGIRRLLGALAAQEAATGPKLRSGALLGELDIALRMGGSTWDLVGTPKDAALQAALDSIFASRDRSYGVAVVDLSDPAAPAWAGVREHTSQLPGSVGKIGVMLALFDGLARAFPEVERREALLRQRIVVAEDWALGDPHTTPHYDAESGRNRSSHIQLGERFNLAEWIDHMISASSNSAGSTVWKEAMLLRRYGAAYPPSVEEEHRFFEETPKKELAALSLAVIEEPLAAVGVGSDEFRQGTLYTRAGSARIPGTKSSATPYGLVRILLHLEQGSLVDAWSSLEMKRYLYMTRKRYRYAYAPELDDAALFFKSGSFYKCAPEEGFSCKKYHGNVENLMNSVAIVEAPARPKEGERQRRYLVGLVSNVKRVNSAWDHARLAAAIDAAVRTRAPVSVKESATTKELKEAGEGE